MLSLVESVASEPALMILRFKSMEFDISGSNFNAHICSYALREKSLFLCIWTEYGDLRSNSPYSVRIQENTDHKNFLFGYFSGSDGIK